MSNRDQDIQDAMTLLRGAGIYVADVFDYEELKQEGFNLPDLEGEERWNFLYERLRHYEYPTLEHLEKAISNAS